MSRKIPSVMFSQHPDHAHQPYWHDKNLIAAHHEIKECYLMFKDLGAQEMMWDWEGKLVDESVMERLLARFPGFFRRQPLGKDLFLTFRVPNPRVESGYRLARALMVILSSRHLAEEWGMTNAPLFEVILPLTESAGEMIKLQRSFSRLSQASGCSFGLNSFSGQMLEVIPLFEKVSTILKSRQILSDYLTRYQKIFKSRPDYLRPFLARSDPALNSGIVPTTLALKWALSELSRFSQETNLPLYPIIAPGVLPFRGGLSPLTTREFMTEFAGIRTIVIQSGFRYDFPQTQVKLAIKDLITNIPQSSAPILTPETFQEIKQLIPLFEKPYKQTVEKLAPLLSKIAKYIPARRERVQHIGLFGYSRTVGKVRLPRAIGFAAGCYSLGLPPELFGIAPGLIKAKKMHLLKTLEKLYQNFRPSLIRAGRYLRKASLQELNLPELAKEIETIEAYLGEPLGPKTKAELAHQKLVGQIIASLKKSPPSVEAIEQAALLRHSLG